MNGISFKFTDCRDDKTEAHSAQTLKNRKSNNEDDVSIVGNSKDKNHEDEDEGSLSAHNNELCDDMRKENFTW